MSRKTCLFYDRPKLPSANQIETALASGLIKSLDPVGPKLLGKILAGASASRFIPNENRAIIEAQGLLPERDDS